MKNFARIISIIFHPLPAITYTVAGALLCTYMAMYPLNVKLLLLGTTFLWSMLIPGLFILLLKNRKIISDLDVSKRKERVIPYLSYLISAGVGVYILYRMQIPFWLLSILTSSLIAIAIAACINIFWKISVHCIAIGGLLGGLMGISYIYSINPFWGFIAGFLIAGLVGTARVELRRHTLGQVFAGLALGFACTFVSSSLSFIYLFI